MEEGGVAALFRNDRFTGSFRPGEAEALRWSVSSSSVLQ